MISPIAISRRKVMLLLSDSALSIGAALQAGADPLHRFRQQHHEGGAHQRAHDRAGAADDDHRQEQDRAFDAETFVRDHQLVMRIERAGDAGEERRQPERQRAVFGQVDAHDLGGEIMVADRDQRAAVARAHQVGHQEIADHAHRPAPRRNIAGRRGRCSRKSRTDWRWPAPSRRRTSRRARRNRAGCIARPAWR